MIKNYFRIHGADGAAVFELGLRLRRQFGKDLIVRYPFGTCGHGGANPLREGVPVPHGEKWKKPKTTREDHLADNKR